MDMLVLDNPEKTKIFELKYFAENNMVSLEDLKKMLSEESKLIYDNPKFTITLPNDYRVVYVLVQHEHKLIKHITIASVNYQVPPQQDTDVILKEFGFDMSYNYMMKNQTQIWFEKLYSAVNVLQMVEKYYFTQNDLQIKEILH